MFEITVIAIGALALYLMILAMIVQSQADDARIEAARLDLDRTEAELNLYSKIK